MSDTPTFAAGGASPAPSPAPAPPPASASTAPTAPGLRPSAPPNPRSIGHSPARDYREAVAARAAGEGTPGEAPPPPAGDQEQPAADAGTKVKVGRYEIDERSLGEMMQRQASDDLR